MSDYPTREQWTEQQRKSPRLPDGSWSTRPPPASDRFEDYASGAYHDVIRALKQVWRDLGCEVKAAAPHSDAKLMMSGRRRDINDVIKHLQKDHARLPIYTGHNLTREELWAMVPLLGEINARYTAAQAAASRAYGEWWNSMAVADVSDEAWATELERRREYEERRRQRAEELAAYEAGREERERQQREAAIARGVATRAKRREKNFREAVQALRDNALRPGDRCRCCKKALTDPESIARSIGPECWEIILKVVQREQAA